MSIKAGATSQTIMLVITDASGDPLTGLAYNTSGLTCYYVRPRAAAVAVTLATLAAVDSAWASGGFKEISAANMAGVYRFDVPNAAIAAGADSVVLYFQGGSTMVPLPIKIDLVAYDPQQDDLGLTIPGTSSIASAVQAGTSLADLANMITGDGTSTPQFTEDALANGPSGGSASSTRLLVTPLKSGRIEPVRYTRGATGPDLRDWVVDGSGNRIDVTGYTVTATMIRVGTEGVVFEDAAASLGAAPTEGQVELEWPDDSLSNAGEFRLIWSLASGGEVLTLSTLVVVE